MVNQQTLSGNWNELKGKLRKKWGQLTNDDVKVFDGNVERLVGMIQSKTGEARNNVERYLEEMTSSGASTMNQAAETVRDYAGQAVQAIEQGSQQAADSMRQGYQAAENTVRSRPGESVAICFGAGVLTGLLLALTFRR